MEGFDIFGLVETWMEEKEWKIRNKLLSKYNWRCIPATKEKGKGRAKGGIIMAISKELKKIEARELDKGRMEIKFIYNGNKWRLITLYSQGRR